MISIRSAVTSLVLCVAALSQTPLDNSTLGKPPTDSWPTSDGDYSGRRFSPLKNINSSNVKALSLAWVYRPNTGSGSAAIKGTPLMVNGVMYITAPDHAWAVDARTGRDLWHYGWQSKGGWHLGNRGAGIYGSSLYFETPDCNLVALNIKDGKERWHKSICDLYQMYYGSAAPIVVKNHLIIGVSGDDTDVPGYVDARDPETGELQWRFNVEPKPGEAGSETWPNAEAMAHGGGMTWGTKTYDPELNLIYFGTGNPQPVIAGGARAGDNLYTESIVAVNADSGKMAWYFQASPHDTHDWDAIETPVLFDGKINGQPRKLLAQASRNGWFFVVDRTNGKSIVSVPFVSANWSKGVNVKGEPMPDPAKEPQIDGALVNPNQGGAANWPPPSFSPDTGLFYVNASNAYSVYYIYDTDEKPEGWGGNDRGGWSESMLEALDYQTGKPKWIRKWSGNGPKSGLLSTAGNLVFCGDGSGNVVALNAATGDPLWHAGLGNSVTNSPITYMLDGSQYMVVAASDTIYAFVMN